MNQHTTGHSFMVRTGKVVSNSWQNSQDISGLGKYKSEKEAVCLGMCGFACQLLHVDTRNSPQNPKPKRSEVTAQVEPTLACHATLIQNL